MLLLALHGQKRIAFFQEGLDKARKGAKGRGKGRGGKGGGEKGGKGGRGGGLVGGRLLKTL